MTTTTDPADTIISMKRSELESLIRNIIREELKHVLRPINPLDDWSQEGPDDPEGDEIIAREALAQIEEYEKNPYRRMTLEEYEAELARAEAAGELSS